MASKNVILTDKAGNQLAPATTAEQVRYDGSSNVKQAISRASGHATTANMAADMTDTTRIYVYTGSESGYTAGNWYYYDGTAWVSGGRYTDSVQFETDTTLSVSGKAADAKIVGDELSSIKSGFDGLLTEVPTGNLFNPEDIITGSVLMPWDGSVYPYEGTFHSFVKLNGAGSYSFLTPYYLMADNSNAIPLFDSNKTFITYAMTTLTDYDANHKIATVSLSEQAFASGAYYIGISEITAVLDTLMVVKSATYPTSYIPYGTYKTIQGLQISQSQIVDFTGEKSLSGKIISFNGDSICAGAGYEGGYGKIIAEENDMIYENIAVGGGTVAYAGTNVHCISRTVNNMRSDADYIILDGGGNDADSGIPTGTLSTGYTATLDDTTFAGAFEAMLKAALERFPGKKIGYIFIHKCATGFDSRNTSESSFYMIAKKACEKWGIPYIDLNSEAPPLGYISSLRTAYTNQGDGYHPNEAGYRAYYVPKITAWLKTL